MTPCSPAASYLAIFWRNLHRQCLHLSLNKRSVIFSSQFRWPCSLRRRFVATRLIRSRFRIPLRAWTLVCCVVSVAASATGWSLVQRSPTGCVCVCVCLIVYDLETSNSDGLGQSRTVVPHLTGDYEGFVKNKGLYGTEMSVWYWNVCMNQKQNFLFVVT